MRREVVRATGMSASAVATGVVPGQTGNRAAGPVATLAHSHQPETTHMHVKELETPSLKMIPDYCAIGSVFKLYQLYSIGDGQKRRAWAELEAESGSHWRKGEKRRWAEVMSVIKAINERVCAEQQNGKVISHHQVAKQMDMERGTMGLNTYIKKHLPCLRKRQLEAAMALHELAGEASGGVATTQGAGTSGGAANVDLSHRLSNAANIIASPSRGVGTSIKKGNRKRKQYR